MKTFLAILILVVLGGLKYETNVESMVVNVIHQGLAIQSSTVPGQGEAYRAIDGNNNTAFLKGSCSQTTNQYQPWWTVDLRRGYLIANVSITSVMQTVQQRAPWAQIQVGESLENFGLYNPSCAVITSMTAGTTQTFPCGGIIGRYITVFIPSRIDTLTLCEVQVVALNVPDLQLGLMINSESTSGSGVLQNNAEMMTQALWQNLKTNIRILSVGVDNVLQRVNQTCIPINSAMSSVSSL